MIIIQSIEITNFRSIVKLEKNFSVSDLNIVVGKNDIGKSNFLKALNLFFNGETDIGKPFSFTEYKNVRNFKNHPYFSSVIARKILKRLSYDDEFIEKICYLIKMHDSHITFYDVSSNYDLSYELYLNECLFLTCMLYQTSISFQILYL